MNRWGTGPIANRAASYWLAELFHQDAMQRVHDTLRLDIVEFHDEVRAAAAILLHLHSAGCWPSDTTETQLALALSRLEEIKHENLFAGDPATCREIDEEILALRERLALAVEDS